jgi:hypothetical protein
MAAYSTARPAYHDLEAKKLHAKHELFAHIFLNILLISMENPYYQVVGLVFNCYVHVNFYC